MFKPKTLWRWVLKNIHSNESLPGLCSPEDIWCRIHCYINCWGRKFMFWLTSSNCNELNVIWIPGCNIHNTHIWSILCIYIYTYIVTLFINIYVYTRFICSLCIRTWRSTALLWPIGSHLGLPYRSQSFTADGERWTWIEHKQTSPEIAPLKAMDIYIDSYWWYPKSIFVDKWLYNIMMQVWVFSLWGMLPMFLNISTTVVMF